MLNNQVIMVHSVTTLPKFRGRGYVRRIMEVAIAHGLRRASFPITLFASPFGIKLYKSMGFEEIYQMEHFLFKP